MQNPLPLETLERRAQEQRQRMQDSVEELRDSVRETLDVNHLLQGHFVPAAVIAALAALSLGYSFGSIFRRE